MKDGENIITVSRVGVNNEISSWLSRLEEKVNERKWLSEEVKTPLSLLKMARDVYMEDELENGCNPVLIKDVLEGKADFYESGCASNLWLFLSRIEGVDEGVLGKSVALLESKGITMDPELAFNIYATGKWREHNYVREVYDVLKHTIGSSWGRKK